MEIIYHLRESDLIAGRRFARKISPAVKSVNRTALIIFVVLPCIGFLLRQRYTLLAVSQTTVEIIMLTSFFFITTTLLNPLLDRQAVATVRKKNGGLLGEHKISLTKDVLIESTSVNESHHKWSGVEGIYQNDDYILIVIGSQGVHIIPKRAFVSNDAVKEFYNQASSYLKNAQTA